MLYLIGFTPVTIFLYAFLLIALEKKKNCYRVCLFFKNQFFFFFLE